MNRFFQNKLEKVVDNNLPLIQSTIKEIVLPQIKGSIQKRENQIYAFQLLYKAFDKIPILNVITTFVNEDAFVEFCMPHAEKYLGTLVTDSEELNEEIEQSESDNEVEEDLPSIDKLFVADELLKLKELMDIEAITLEEFNEKKSKIISL